MTAPTLHGDALDQLLYEDRAVEELLKAFDDETLDRRQHGEVAKLLVEHLAVREAAKEYIAEGLSGRAELAGVADRMLHGVAQRRSHLRRLDELARGVEAINVNQGQSFDAAVGEIRPALADDIRHDVEELVPLLHDRLDERARHKLFPSARFVRAHAPTHPGAHGRRWYERINPLVRLHAAYDFLRGFPKGGSKPSAEVDVDVDMALPRHDDMPF